MIHDTAIVDPAAQLGANVSIGPYTCIDGDVAIGDNCAIGPHVCIMRHTTLGPGCNVHAGAVLGDIPQDTAFKDCESGVRIGADCVIREGVTVHRGAKPGTATEVGNGCWLMGFSHLAHNVKLGERVIVVNNALLAGYVTVGDGAFISGSCGIHQFSRIGRLAMLGGNCSVTKDVPPFCTLRAGSLNGLAGMNIVGMRRAGVSGNDLKAVRAVFRILFRSGLNISDAVAKVRRSLPDSPPAAEMCDFIEGSERGVCTLQQRITPTTRGSAHGK